LLLRRYAESLQALHPAHHVAASIVKLLPCLIEGSGKAGYQIADTQEETDGKPYNDSYYFFYIEVVLTFYFVKIERISYLCISKPRLKFLSCTKY